ncbi:MAG: hypothetical protein LLG93_01060, partial [Deltaproteobacteria bacterium]|nr:hypothetical protein [Deltaproteobacteria bacterium]
EEKDDKESWAGFGYGQMKNLKTGEIVKVPTVPREGGGSKADAKKEWTKGDVRQEYNNLNGYLNKVESDLAKQIETEGESADLSEQLAKVRNIRKGLMKYRSDDEWSVSDENSSERGKYPRNLQKIADYLAGFGEQEKPKDITQMKPTAKGSATGKVRKPLDDIL